MKVLLTILMSIMLNYHNSYTCDLPSAHFDMAKITIKEEFKPDLEMVANYLNQKPTQKLNVRGWDITDINIAILRAEKCVGYLTENYHFSCERFTTSADLMPKPKESVKNTSTKPINYLFRRVDFECL